MRFRSGAAWHWNEVPALAPKVHFVDIVWIFLFPFLYLIHGVHHHG